MQAPDKGSRAGGDEVVGVGVQETYAPAHVVRRVVGVDQNADVAPGSAAADDDVVDHRLHLRMTVVTEVAHALCEVHRPDEVHIDTRNLKEGVEFGNGGTTLYLHHHEPGLRRRGKAVAHPLDHRSGVRGPIEARRHHSVHPTQEIALQHPVLRIEDPHQ